MIKILQIRPNVFSKTDGINTYCLALKELFERDNDIEILPIENYSGKNTIERIFDVSIIRNKYKSIYMDVSLPRK